MASGQGVPFGRDANRLTGPHGGGGGWLLRALEEIFIETTLEYTTNLQKTHSGIVPRRKS
jgi:hypothetical protein